MKNIFALALSLLFAGSVNASPITFSLDGNVNYISGGTAAGDAGLSVGSAISYTIVVDFNSDGTYTYDSGATIDTLVDSAQEDYFFADLLSGPTVMADNGGGPGFESNLGINYLDSIIGTLIVDDSLYLSNYDYLISDWGVGTAISVSNLWKEGGSQYLWMGNLSITTMTPSASTNIPSPGTFFLLLAGLIYLLFHKNASRPSYTPLLGR